MIIKPFAQRVLDAMKEQGISAAELSRLSGVSYDVINKFKHRPDSSTKADNARRLATALNLDHDDVDLSESMPAPDADLVDIYNVQASAGHGSIIEDEEIVSRLAFPPGYLQRITKSSPANLAIISVKGDSMLPTLADDDLVMVDTGKTSLDFDGLFVLRFGEALHVKRIARAEIGKVRIISDNRGAYPAIEIRKEEVGVVGKVIWLGKKA